MYNKVKNKKMNEKIEDSVQRVRCMSETERKNCEGRNEEANMYVPN